LTSGPESAIMNVSDGDLESAMDSWRFKAKARSSRLLTRAGAGGLPAPRPPAWRGSEEACEPI